MKRLDIVNHYLKQFSEPRSYLEIGVDAGATFDSVDASNKDGVDPDISCKCNYHMTSDDFFKINQKKYDVIFIDGLHHCEQVCRDINNSLNYLKSNGVILLHDCIPENEIVQRVPRCSKTWTGDVWKAFVLFRCVRQDLEMFVIDTDYGVGVIKPNRCQILYNRPEVLGDFSLFAGRKQEALNMLTIDQWKQRDGAK